MALSIVCERDPQINAYTGKFACNPASRLARQCVNSGSFWVQVFWLPLVCYLASELATFCILAYSALLVPTRSLFLETAFARVLYPCSKPLEMCLYDVI